MAKEADSSRGENSTWTKAESTFNKYVFCFPQYLQHLSPYLLTPFETPHSPCSSWFLHIYMYTKNITNIFCLFFVYFYSRKVRDIANTLIRVRKLLLGAWDAYIVIEGIKNFARISSSQFLFLLRPALALPPPPSVQKHTQAKSPSDEKLAAGFIISVSIEKSGAGGFCWRGRRNLEHIETAKRSGYVSDHFLSRCLCFAWERRIGPPPPKKRKKRKRGRISFCWYITFFLYT